MVSLVIVGEYDEMKQLVRDGAKKLRDAEGLPDEALLAINRPRNTASTNNNHNLTNLHHHHQQQQQQQHHYNNTSTSSSSSSRKRFSSPSHRNGQVGIDKTGARSRNSSSSTSRMQQQQQQQQQHTMTW